MFPAIRLGMSLAISSSEFNYPVLGTLGNPDTGCYRATSACHSTVHSTVRQPQRSHCPQQLHVTPSRGHTHSTMSVFHTDDTGGSRRYNFRRIKTTAIRFRVKAEHDVAVILSPANEEDDGEVDEGYEVFIGCWGGDESGIRKRGTGEDVLKVHTPGILEGGEDFLPFWIKIKRGVIKVGKSRMKSAFMTYSDPSLRHCTWYGYSTGWGAEGDWIFPDEEDTSSSSSSAFSSSDSEAEEVNAMEERPIQYKRPARWVPSSGGYFPHRPVSGGEGPDGEVYVGMARHEDAYVVGMVVPGHSCCYVPFGGAAIPKSEYFVLSSPASVNLSWEPGSMGKVPAGALQGGLSEDGEVLYIGRVSVDGDVSVGKVHPSHSVCYVPYGGSEHAHKNYEVLCVRGVTVKV